MMENRENGYDMGYKKGCIKTLKCEFELGSCVGGRYGKER